MYTPGIDFNQQKYKSDIKYAIDLMKLYTLEQNGEQGVIIEKDGLLFYHIESPYERGLNTLVLHWRDPEVSNYCFNEDDDSNANSIGLVSCVLRLNDKYQF